MGASVASSGGLDQDVISLTPTRRNDRWQCEYGRLACCQSGPRHQPFQTLISVKCSSTKCRSAAEEAAKTKVQFPCNTVECPGFDPLQTRGLPRLRGGTFSAGKRFDTVPRF